MHESIALLDFLCSLAIYSSSGAGCVKPELTKDGPLVIKKGRHPIMEKIHKIPFIPVLIALDFHF